MTETTATSTAAGDSSAAGTTTVQQTDAGGKTEAEQAWDTLEAAEAKDAAADKGRSNDGKAGTTEGATSAATTAAAKTEAQTGTETQQTGPDIWASAPTELKAAYGTLKSDLEAARADFSKLDQAAKSDRGRIAAFQRQIADLKKTSAGTSATDKPADAKSIFETPAWLEFKTEYPEVAKAQEAALAPLLGQIEGVKKQTDGLAKERTDQALDAEYNTLVADHPDYPTIAKSKAFTDWYNGLDRDDPEQEGIARAVEANAEQVVDGKKVSKIVAKFKASTGQATGQQTTAAGKNDSGSTQQARTALDDKRDVQLESSSSPRSQGMGAVTNGIPGDAKGAWDAFERMGL